MVTDMYLRTKNKWTYSLIVRSRDFNVRDQTFTATSRAWAGKNNRFQSYLCSVCDGELLACPWCRYPTIFVEPNKQGPHCKYFIFCNFKFRRCAPVKCLAAKWLFRNFKFGKSVGDKCPACRTHSLETLCSQLYIWKVACWNMPCQRNLQFRNL